MSKNIPPLTQFEEEFLATRLMQKVPTTSSMLDAQLFLHNEAIGVVKQNYRLKVRMKTFITIQFLFLFFSDGFC
jgi:hypothetical protein